MGWNHQLAWDSSLFFTTIWDNMVWFTFSIRIVYLVANPSCEHMDSLVNQHPPKIPPTEMWPYDQGLLNIGFP